ncbi:MAG: endonuclease III [Phycisphaerales bacterium]|nr:MAG: endonuclease III [Phycisphaerales bacterium]
MIVRTPENPRHLRDLPFRVPEVTAAQRARARRIAQALAERYPHARCALDYRTPHELLVATILSAQSTDAGVNKATPALFKAFPRPEDYARASPAQIERYIRTIGLHRSKAKAIHQAMRRIVEHYGGQVPRTMDELLTLRGVARKTASVVLGNAFGINEGFVVDTHIERVAKRFALAPHSATVAMVERYLIAQFPRDQWTILSHRFIAHGRAVCKARHWLCEQDAICRRFCENARRREPRAVLASLGETTV